MTSNGMLSKDADTQSATSGMNTSGIQPREYKVLVRPDEVEEVTKGGIVKAISTVEAEQRAICFGTLVANSPHAFNFEAGMEKIEPGTRVLYAKYAGGEVKGPADGITYRIMNDKDIMGEIVHEGDSVADEVPILHFPGAGVAA